MRGVIILFQKGGDYVLDQRARLGHEGVRDLNSPCMPLLRLLVSRRRGVTRLHSVEPHFGAHAEMTHDIQNKVL